MNLNLSRHLGGDDEMKVVGKYFAKHFACIGHERVKLIFFYLYTGNCVRIYNLRDGLGYTHSCV